MLEAVFTLPMKSIISCLFGLSLLSSSSHALPCHFPAIFNFGDSNSDTGGLSAAFGQAGPPHGVSFFGSPAGRYCDGRLVIDFIGNLLINNTLFRRQAFAFAFC